MKRILALAVFLILLSVPPARAGSSAASTVDLKDDPTITVDTERRHPAVALGGNRTLVFSNGQKGGKYLLVLKQDATGSRTVTLPSSVRWPGRTPLVNPPLLTTTAGKTWPG